MNEAGMSTRIKILESYNYCPSGNTSQLCGGSISWQRGGQALVLIVRAHMYFFSLMMLGTLLGTFGRAPLVKEMTTSSIAILLTRRYPNPNDCKSGTKRCWTNLCQSALSMITRFVKCMFVWGGGGVTSLVLVSSLPCALCLILGVYSISFKWIEH